MKTVVPRKAVSKRAAARSPAARPPKAAPARREAVPGPTPKSLRAKIVRIGNSRGVRLPKAVIEQAGLSEQVEISVRGRDVILRAVEAADPRAGWDEAFKRAIAKHGNELTDEDREWLDAPLNTEFDEKEWTW